MNPRQIVACKVQSKRTLHAHASQETESLTRSRWLGGRGESIAGRPDDGLGPAEHPVGYGDGLDPLLVGHAFGNARIASLDRVSSQVRGDQHIGRDLNAVLRRQRKKIRDRMCSGKANPAMAAARAKLLRALRNHSWASPASRHSDTINDPPLFESWTDDRAYLVAVALDVLGRHDDDVDRNRQTE